MWFFFFLIEGNDIANSKIKRNHPVLDKYIATRKNNAKNTFFFFEATVQVKV